MRYISFLLVVIVFGSCQSQEKSKELSPESFKQAIDQDKEAILIDVRTPGEVAKGMIPGAVNIDINGRDFIERAARLDKDKTYYVYCLSGSRSARAATHFKEIGISEVYNMKGGILGWQKAGLPVIGAQDVKDKISNEQ